jgi:hypothetical protein
LTIFAETLDLLTMTPDEALEEQVRRYRQMTGEQRLLIALRLHELCCEIARDAIRRQFPGATPEEVEQHLHRRLELARS